MVKVVRVFFFLFEVLILVESHQANIVLLVVVLPILVGVQDLLHVHYYLFYLTKKGKVPEGIKNEEIKFIGRQLAEMASDGRS